MSAFACIIDGAAVGMAMIVIADVTAFSIYIRFWFPKVDRWTWDLAIIFFLAGLRRS